MEARVTIRAARNEDYGALQHLWRQLDTMHARLQAGFFRLPSEPRPACAIGDARASWSEAILVAEEGGRIVGVVQLKLLDTPGDPFKTPRRRALVEDLVVDQGERRRGIGGALMTAATQWARRRGAEQLVLTLWTGNAEAEAFYEGLGYRTVSRFLARDL
jgi:GNAT superfamily N-acetyltransferase